MGTNASNSVVDSHQRSWDHENLWLVGGGSMPTIGTANITLTMQALTFRAARAMIEALKGGPSTVGRRVSDGVPVAAQ